MLCPSRSASLGAGVIDAEATARASEVKSAADVVYAKTVSVARDPVAASASALIIGWKSTLCDGIKTREKELIV